MSRNSPQFYLRPVGIRKAITNDIYKKILISVIRKGIHVLFIWKAKLRLTTF